jgi:hypothetical protein
VDEEVTVGKDGDIGELNEVLHPLIAREKDIGPGQDQRREEKDGDGREGFHG